MNKKRLVELVAFLVLICIPSIKGTRSYFSDSNIFSGNTFSVASASGSPTATPTTTSTPTLTPTPSPTPTVTPTATPTPSPTPQNIANHVVINEVQISGDGTNSSDDEFVELYNPTDSVILMDRWKLTRKNSAGTEGNLVDTLNGAIPVHGYFLIVDNIGYNESSSPDLIYSSPSNDLTNNYTVLLYSDNKITLVDKVGFGTAVDKETADTINPPANTSIERKSPGYDTGDNSNDFVLRANPDPQNSLSPAEVP